jgi:hypothetical protein
MKTVYQQSEFYEAEINYSIWQYLLVWNSADTTRKERCLLVILVEIVKTPGS